MIWYENLYIGESIPKKNAKIRRLKWKIDHSKCLTNAFIIVLCRYGTNLLEIIPARELCQKAYPKRNLYVVGLARGYDDALYSSKRKVTAHDQGSGAVFAGAFETLRLDAASFAGAVSCSVFAGVVCAGAV